MTLKKDSKSINSEQEKSQNDDVSLPELNNLDNVVPAIAITIHKSQGSESEKVSVLWSKKYRRNQYAVKGKKDNETIFCRDNFERRLFYTAVTRAKKFLNIYYLN